MKTILCLLLIASAPFAFAQQRQQPTQGNNQGNQNSAADGEKPYADDANPHKRFWRASLPGGSYMVALDRIASVSKHEYLLDGNLIITEVNIDTVGNSAVRIYQITPAASKSGLDTAKRLVERGTELLDKAGQRTGTDPNSAVHKTYPLTTHTKTIEYRVKNVATLNALLASVSKAWVDGKGRHFKVN